MPKEKIAKTTVGGKRQKLMFHKQAKYLSEGLKTENLDFKLRTIRLKGSYFETNSNNDLKHLK